MTPPGPFREHERYLAYNDYLVGGLMLVTFAIITFALGLHHSASGLAVETVTNDAGQTGFVVEKVGMALFEGSAISALGIVMLSLGHELLDRAHWLRQCAKSRNMANVAITVTLIGGIMHAITNAAETTEAER